jgi:hypothetical protein
VGAAIAAGSPARKKVLRRACAGARPAEDRLLRLSPAAPKITACTPPGTLHRYYFNSARLPFAQAEAVCNTLGGHLVSYANLTDQTAAEQCFVNNAALLPTFHKAYWMGLRIGEHATVTGTLFIYSPAGTNGLLLCPADAEQDAAMWPNFTWVDHTWATNVGGYQHWGNLTMADGSKRPEPNNMASPEHCAAANFTTSFKGAAGWADQRCTTNLTSICGPRGCGWPAGRIVACS